MKISVVMIDGGFRENTHGAKFFSEQDFDSYEVIWVDYYDKVPPEVCENPNVRVIRLNRTGEYHSSYCFNEGIRQSRGELIVIPDADQVVEPDFLQGVWESHEANPRLVLYCYRYDEMKRGELTSLEFAELHEKCELKNPANYGGCLTVRKHWLEVINGYEQHGIFETGNHANGLDVYTRLKNLGLDIAWHPELKLFHPWHPFTLSQTTELKSQQRLIQWRARQLQSGAFDGLDRARNEAIPEPAAVILDEEMERLAGEKNKLGNGRGSGTEGIGLRLIRSVGRVGQRFYRRYLDV